MKNAGKKRRVRGRFAPKLSAAAVAAAALFVPFSGARAEEPSYNSGTAWGTNVEYKFSTSGGRWDVSRDLGNYAIYDNHRDRVYTLGQGVELSISTQSLIDFHTTAYPFATNLYNAVGATALLVTSFTNSQLAGIYSTGLVRYLGEAAGDGSHPTIRITNVEDRHPEHYYHQYWYSSAAPNNYSVVVYGRMADENGGYEDPTKTEYAATLSMEGVNLDLNHVTEGMFASRGGYISIKDADFVNVLADNMDILQHHAVSVDNGMVEISAGNVTMAVAGKATEIDDPVSVFSSTLYEVNGGTIRISANTLTLSNTVDNTYISPYGLTSANYAAYAIGQADSMGNGGILYPDRSIIPGKVFGSEGVITLTGTGESPVLNVISKGAYFNAGLISGAYLKNASISAGNFASITLEAAQELVGEGAASPQQPVDAVAAYAWSNADNTSEISLSADQSVVSRGSRIGLYALSAPTMAYSSLDMTRGAGLASVRVCAPEVAVSSSGGALYAESAYDRPASVSADARNVALISEGTAVLAVAGDAPDAEDDGAAVDFDIAASVGISASGTLSVRAKEGLYANAYKGGADQSVGKAGASVAVKETGTVDIRTEGAAVRARSQNGRRAEVTVGAKTASFASSGSDAVLAEGTAGSDTVDLLIALDASETLSVFAPDGHHAVLGTGAGSVAINTRASGTTEVTGAVNASAGSEVSIGLNTEDSYWVGSSQDNRQGGQPGSVSVTAGHNALWKVLPNEGGDMAGGTDAKSYLTVWTSEGSSRIDLRRLSAANDAQAPLYQRLDIGTLSGSGTVFYLNTDAGGERGEGISTDQSVIHTGSGAHVIDAASAGAEPEGGVQKDFLIWHMEEGGASSVPIADPNTGAAGAAPEGALSFVLSSPTGKIDIGLHTYVLATRDAQDGDGTEWFLTRFTGGSGPDPISPPGDEARHFGGFGAQTAVYYAQLDDLRKRLGEVRYGAQDGAWARVIAQKSHITGVGSGAFRQKWYGINLGWDSLVSRTEDRQWLLGGNFKYGSANQRMVTDRNGKGDLESYGANLYATYASEYGSYADFVLTADRHGQKMKTLSSDLRSVRGSYHTWGFGASIEVGKMFSSAQDDEGWGPWYNHWWIEPQAQLSYYWIKGKNFSLDNGMAISQKDGNSLVGRLGVVAGKQFKYGRDREEMSKRYSQFYVKAGVKKEFLGDQTIYINDTEFKGGLSGATFYYGAGADWNFSDQMRFYVQFEREKGGHYTKDYEVSAGLKWQF